MPTGAHTKDVQSNICVHNMRAAHDPIWNPTAQLLATSHWRSTWVISPLCLTSSTGAPPVLGTDQVMNPDIMFLLAASVAEPALKAVQGSGTRQPAGVQPQPTHGSSGSSSGSSGSSGCGCGISGSSGSGRPALGGAGAVAGAASPAHMVLAIAMDAMLDETLLSLIQGEDWLACKLQLAGSLTCFQCTIHICSPAADDASREDMWPDFNCCPNLCFTCCRRPQQG